MQRLFALLLILISFAVLPLTALADYSSNICTSGTICYESEIGAFMKGVTAECGNKGNCTLQDIEILIGNIGNFVLRIVGTALLIMYIYGGYTWLRHGGNSGKVAEGKKIISVATVGFLIVMFAYVGITTLIGIITDKKISSPYDISEGKVVCTTENDGQLCGDNKFCESQVCMPRCLTLSAGYSCMTINPSLDKWGDCYTATSGCPTGLSCCPNFLKPKP